MAEDTEQLLRELKDILGKDRTPAERQKDLKVKAEALVLKAKSYSNEYSAEADIIRGKVYLAQGDILLKNGQYSRSLNKYQKAVNISNDLYYLVNEKEKTLAKAFLSDASKAFELGDLIFIIESLKQSQKLNPEIDSEYNELLIILENLKN